VELEQVFRSHAAYVCETLRRLGVRSADVEDAAHDVFLVFHRKQSEYDVARPIKPWLYGIAARIAMRYRSKDARRREDFTADHDTTHAGASETDRDAERARRKRLLHRALESVHPSRLDVLVLHDLDGVSMPDIVAELGIPLNTGYSRLRLARRDLAEALTELGVREAV
jgi:RNA polymerase sigma-70 factor (ECF subfamily)